MDANAARFDDRGISLSSARKILGKEGDCYSDEQLEDILSRIYEIAEFGMHQGPTNEVNEPPL